MNKSELSQWLLTKGYGEERRGYGHATADEIAEALMAEFEVRKRSPRSRPETPVTDEPSPRDELMEAIEDSARARRDLEFWLEIRKDRICSSRTTTRDRQGEEVPKG